ncbi:MAG: ABC transporter substrate-binding protein [Oligoflexales bacterium]|nr:ABC transporter substrate-binding protein [Oligoflexales bacterium]
MAQGDTPNIALFAMARTPDRDPLYHWVGPVMEVNYSFIVKADSKIVINNMDDAKKLTAIGVFQNDARDVILTKAGFTNLDRNITGDLNYKKLMMGRLDAVAASDLFPVKAVDAGFSPKDFRIVYSFKKIQLYVVMSKKTDPAIVKTWNDTLDNMKKDGTFLSIQEKYLPNRPMPGPANTKLD